MAFAACFATVQIYKTFDKLKQCGGSGTCGTCRVKVTEGAANCSKQGLGEHTACQRDAYSSLYCNTAALCNAKLQVKLLGKADADIRLACCTRVTGPVSVTVKP
eukprot:7378-Heterococcus_DN1.PRE.4